MAILGRFKAGKSSVLNHLLARRILPVGAIPVTTVGTEIEYGPDERAEVVFRDGSTQAIQSQRISEFVSETENPENSRRVVCVRVQLPAMERYRGIRFVDTPGLESVLEHNTEASLDWLPNVGLALVAVGVDPPLSQHDIELIRNLSRYTPHISLLLTKVDVLDDSERTQVQEFVQKQLARYWDKPLAVFPFSTRPGFESLRTEIDEKLLSRARAEAGEHRAAILRHKVDSLLSECSEYLTLASKAAETDRNWELLSFLLPMWVIGGVVRRHFEHKVADVVFMNLSRLAGQWDAVVNASITALEKEAMRWLDGLIGTIEKLIAAAGQEAPRIRADLLKLEELRDQL
ncbi:MAG: dynamin family protein [Acidobacteriia bacterium]|nr:dynamin family protein [Terriglobia bacterium]